MATRDDGYESMDTEIIRVETGAVGAISKSEVEAQIDAAHKYPRSVKRYLDDAISLATFSKEIAEKCSYAVERAGEIKVGPSVRLAEICASAYGNMHIGARVIDETERTIVGQGVAWDLQKNLRISVEAARRITGKTGRRYGDDMVVMTGNAAVSIALRNAVFRVIPRSLIQPVYQAAQGAATGELKTLPTRRAEVLEKLAKQGATVERVLARLGRASVLDVDLGDLGTLIAIGVSLKERTMDIDTAFPPVASTTTTSVPAAAEGRRIKMGGKAADAPKEEPPKADAAAPPTEAAKGAPAATDAPEGEPPPGVLKEEQEPPEAPKTRGNIDLTGRAGREPGSDG